VNLYVHGAKLPMIKVQLGICQKTTVDWASFCREVLYHACTVNAEQLGRLIIPYLFPCINIKKIISILGGEGAIVEIDESKFGKRKFHRGHRVEGVWVFGAFERGSGRLLMAPVENRYNSMSLNSSNTDFIYCWILQII